jgi:hypothetical protein
MLPSMTHSDPLSSSIHLRKLLVLLLPPARIANTKAVLEDLADILKGHAPDLWEAKDNEQPSNEANAGVKSECSRGGDSLHHGEEGRRDDDVGRPACHSVQHCANRSYFVRD